MSILNNALSGTQAAQIALSAASQNIANVKTAGYSRQGAVLATISPYGDLRSPGNGVQVSALQRFSDSYKVHQVWNAAANLGQYTPQQAYLTQLERVMGDDASSINNGLDGFFSALNAATLEPTSMPLRQQIITAANTLSQRFNSLNDLLNNQRNAVKEQLAAAVSQINLLSADIGELNKQIAALKVSGGNASALMDARDQRVQSLAGLVGVQVLEQPDGAYNVSLRDGQPLVIKGTVATLSLNVASSGMPTLQVDFANQSFSTTGANLGGQLGGLADFQLNTLLPLQQSVSAIAKTVADSVNAQLAAGTDLNGDPGAALLVYDPTGANGLLQVAAGIEARQLAFSADGTLGDNGNLLKLIDLKGQTISTASTGTVTLGDANTQLLGQLGMASKQNQSLLATAQTVSDQAASNWSETSGVNQDEEAVNLMEFQQMYQANLKVIATANQLFDSVLEMMA